MVGQGVKARASYWWRADGRFRQRQEIEGLGVLESGFDGEVVWSPDPIFGTRELTGLEAAQATWLASPLSWANYPAYVTDAQIEGKVTVAGGDATEVALSVRDGVKATARFPTRTVASPSCPCGLNPPRVQPVTFVFKDYRPVAGYEMPHAQVLRSVTGDIHGPTVGWRSTPPSRTSVSRGSCPRRAATRFRTRPARPRAGHRHKVSHPPRRPR